MIASPLSHPLSQASAAFKKGNQPVADHCFQTVPQEIKNLIYKNLWEIKAQGEVPFNYGELCFTGREGYSATCQEKALAIDCYLLKTSLKPVTRPDLLPNNPEISPQDNMPDTKRLVSDTVATITGVAAAVTLFGICILVELNREPNDTSKKS